MTNGIDDKARAMLPRHMREKLEAAELDATGGESNLPEVDPNADNHDVPADDVTDVPKESGNTDDVAAWRGRFEQASTKLKELEPVVQNHSFVQGKLLEAQDRLKVVEAELAAAKPAAEELASIKAKAEETTLGWTDEKRARMTELLGEEAAKEIEQELIDTKRLVRKAPADVVTKKDLQDRDAQERQSKFFSSVPEKFIDYSRDADSEFMQWAKGTRDGRRTVHEEIAAIVRDRDLSAVDYIAEKVAQFEKSKEPAQQGTVTKPQGGSRQGVKLTAAQVEAKAREIARKDPRKAREFLLANRS